MAHLYRNNLITNFQNGFATNLLESIDFITNSIADKKAVDFLFLDYAKAFDKVSHRRLVQKLEANGITGEISRWIEAFLSGRSQRMVLGDTCSEWTEVTSGVHGIQHGKMENYAFREKKSGKRLLYELHHHKLRIQNQFKYI